MRPWPIALISSLLMIFVLLNMNDVFHHLPLRASPFDRATIWSLICVSIVTILGLLALWTGQQSGKERGKRSEAPPRFIYGKGFLTGIFIWILSLVGYLQIIPMPPQYPMLLAMLALSAAAIHINAQYWWGRGLRRSAHEVASLDGLLIGGTLLWIGAAIYGLNHFGLIAWGQGPSITAPQPTAALLAFAGFLWLGLAVFLKENTPKLLIAIYMLFALATPLLAFVMLAYRHPFFGKMSLAVLDDSTRFLLVILSLCLVAILVALWREGMGAGHEPRPTRNSHLS